MPLKIKGCVKKEEVPENNFRNFLNLQKLRFNEKEQVNHQRIQSIESKHEKRCDPSIEA